MSALELLRGLNSSRRNLRSAPSILAWNNRLASSSSLKCGKLVDPKLWLSHSGSGWDSIALPIALIHDFSSAPISLKFIQRCRWSEIDASEEARCHLAVKRAAIHAATADCLSIDSPTDYPLTEDGDKSWLIDRLIGQTWSVTRLKTPSSSDDQFHGCASLAWHMNSHWIWFDVVQSQSAFIETFCINVYIYTQGLYCFYCTLNELNLMHDAVCTSTVVTCCFLWNYW